MTVSANITSVNKGGITFIDIRHLNGPNIWTYYPVLEAIVDIGALEEFPSNIIPGFYQRLSSWIPSLIEHRCSYEERGGFLRRVKDGTWPGHILEHITLELQNLAGMPGGFGKARETPLRGVYKVIVSAWHKDITYSALFAARELILAAMEPHQPYDVDAAVGQLRNLVEKLWLGPSTACIVDAAMNRNIPAIRLLGEGNLVQLGYGALSQRIWTAETERTPAIAENISRDKNLTKTLLRACGLPVPKGDVANSIEDAWELAQNIGLPVVVKPTDGNHGRGVFIGLTTKEEVEESYRIASEEGSHVLIEGYIPGTEHRLLIVGGELVAANRGDSVSIIGDGISTITELINCQINADPRRGTTENHPLNTIYLDSAVQIEITRQGLNGDSVPPFGLEVLIQRNGNHALDVTDLVHPSIAKSASLAARIVGLDIAGIDLVVSDISHPLSQQGGAIVEVNAGPSLLMHIKPAIGQVRPVGQAILNHLFGKDNDGRIPIVGISGSHGKTTVARLVAQLLVLSGKYTGLACSNGLYLNHRQICRSNSATWDAAERILMNRLVEVAVFENDGKAILSEGLAYDRCTVGVITNIDKTHEHYGLYDIKTPRHIFNVLRTQVDIVLPSGFAVLNAREPMLVEMATLCDGEVIYFALDPELPSIVEHRAQNGRTVLISNHKIILATGSTEITVAELVESALIEEKAILEVENILTAIAVTWALGINLDLICKEIQTFSTIKSS